MATDAIRMRIDVTRFASRLRHYHDTVVDLLDYQVLDVANGAWARIVEWSPVDDGDFQAAWTTPRKLGPLHYEVASNDMPYAMALEYGSTPEQRPWPHVGPRTVHGGGEQFPYGLSPARANIYSSQAPHGMVRRALAAALPELRSQVLHVLRQQWH